ncbi:MAG TPA: acyl-CoA dehydratase activase-related protein, partial [Tissierellaceae bacterium]
MSMYHVGLDIGSTTVKLVIIDDDNNLVYGNYKRHFSDVRKTAKEMILEVKDKLKDKEITMMITGSGGLSLTSWLGVEFIQEVVASTKSIQTLLPETDVAIELGGEDAKITYFKGSLEQRMNSICAGGTGAFIDQMASLLETDAQGLNELAMNHTNIYSIASRCGVFAKTDIQALINQGAKKEDIAASVLQSVVNQTISNLACGRPIRGNVAFLGGPLYFLEELRNRFISTLQLSDDEIIFPENSQLYVAIGAAISSKESKTINFNEVLENLNNEVLETGLEIGRIEPLFESMEEYEEFKLRHDRDKIEELNAKEYKGGAYLGIDAGSTTTKAVLLSEDEKLLYSFYGNNKGKPLDQAVYILKEIYTELPDIEIKSSCVTGYGEDFIKAALKMDFGEVETIAHYKGASLFKEDVDFILDIGGQDMKSMKIEDGVIHDILLNEACSSGCGSFIETFAKSVNMDVGEFLDAGLFAKNPVDLGSRCTVFMNSMVKQAQKEGASIGDISAGLANSVIKNAVQKVIKIRDPKLLGENIVVQGGTFYGDAILRSFEKISGREVIRPNKAGLMGAIGAALISKERQIGESSILNLEELNNFKYTSKNARCKSCENNCMLTINKFTDGSLYITGNRCEKGAGIVVSQKDKLPNMFEYKYKRTFNYKSLEKEEAIRGTVGIPRVLNIYENYPFWHRFFTSLGYRVELSTESSREVYESGLESIPSETACYPAKITHGHIMDLIEKDIDFIFYPSVFYEEREDEKSDDHLNCPVVVGYPELIKHNVNDISEGKVEFLNPFISFDDKKTLQNNLYEELKDKGISKREIKNAVEEAYKEIYQYKQDIRNKGIQAVKELRRNNKKAIVLCGRPYHIDPAINHGIPELIISLGMGVLSEDSIDHLGNLDDDLRVLDQWTYHSRLYRAAEYVSRSEDLELIQLTSFGCGLDAVTTDQVEEILESRNKIYTQLKIDEVSNLGAAKIRVRSLNAALSERENKDIKPETEKIKLYKDRVVFTEENRKNHTILMPQMAPIQFKLIERVLETCGYDLVVLGGDTKDSVDEGLKYVNNDACYPSIIVIGQFIAALKSGKYDLDNTSLLISQTGGVCRASNYTGFLRKALKESGFEDIPVISVSVQGIEKNPGFTFSYDMLKRLVMALLLGDLLTRVTLATRPYEKVKGSTNKLLDDWILKLMDPLENISKKEFKSYVFEIVEDFDNLEILD